MPVKEEKPCTLEQGPCSFFCHRGGFLVESYLPTDAPSQGGISFPHNSVLPFPGRGKSESTEIPQCCRPIGKRVGSLRKKWGIRTVRNRLNTSTKKPLIEKIKYLGESGCLKLSLKKKKFTALFPQIP